MSAKSGAKKQQENNYYRLLAKSSRDIIMTQDIFGKIIYVNPAWTEITGYSAEETEGGRIIDFISPEYIKGLQERYVQRKAGSKEVYFYETEVRNKDGSKVPLEVRSTPVISRDGEFEEILLIARDLRARKAAKQVLVESEVSYSNLFNTLFLRP